MTGRRSPPTTERSPSTGRMFSLYFSAKVTGAEDGAQVASLDDAQVQQLRDIMWEMNAVSSSTRTESHEVEVIITDEDGNETTRTETVTETILRLPSPTKPRRKWGPDSTVLNPRQNEYLALMSEPENQSLWAELLGGYKGGGQIMNPNTDWQGRHFPMAAAAKLHDNVVVRLPGGSFSPGRSPTTAGPTSAHRAEPHSCRSRRNRHHRQRDRFLGRRVRVLHQGKAQRHLRNPVCPLLLHLRNRWAGSKAG